MSRTEIDILWQQALHESVANGELYTRYRFAELVSAAECNKHMSDIERWKGEAAAAEKWRGMACAKNGDGRTVQRIQQEAAAAERAKWEPIIEAVILEHPHRERRDDGNAPGHCHEIPGIWDSDNRELAGKPCAWCAAWKAAKEVIRERGKA